VIVYFGQFYEHDRSSSHFWATFRHGCGFALILTKICWATFWAIFLQTHQVTLRCHPLLIHIPDDLHFPVQFYDVASQTAKNLFFPAKKIDHRQNLPNDKTPKNSCQL
jgi:hypothetical protein